MTKTAKADALLLLPWQRDLLDERIAMAKADPEAVTPWSEVKEQRSNG